MAEIKKAPSSIPSGKAHHTVPVRARGNSRRMFASVRFKIKLIEINSVREALNSSGKTESFSLFYIAGIFLNATDYGVKVSLRFEN